MKAEIEDAIYAAVAQHQAEREAQAAVPEITREMRRAAALALKPFTKQRRAGTSDCDVNAVTSVYYGSPGEIAEAVFEAMCRARVSDPAGEPRRR